MRGLIQWVQATGIERRRELAAVPGFAKMQHRKEEPQEADDCEYGNSDE